MRLHLLCLMLLLVLAAAPLCGTAQDSIPEIDEWEEIMKLRSKFSGGEYGSQYLMGLFDGRFIGPNNQVDFGLRSFTTAYDYLIIGNNFLSLLINLGFTADRIKFLEAGKVPGTKPYELGCIQFYSIAEDKRLVDSVFSTKLGQKVAVDKPYYTKNSRLRIDSSKVQITLGGVMTREKVGKNWKYDTLAIRPINGTGSWKDANNFDLVYEWMEVLFKAHQDSFDISRRPFSARTPEYIRQCILQRFDTKKYLEKTDLTERQLNIKLKDAAGFEVFDMLHVPNGTLLRSGKYELFRYFGDIYYREIPDVANQKNPIYFCAYQYDKDPERNNKGMLCFIRLSYGAGRYIMPTLIPKDLPNFTQFEGVVIYADGTERVNHSNEDDIWINTINGRMVDRNFREYPSEQGILPLNDDGTVDRIYKIYSWKDHKLYWAYIYCGKHAGIRGGKPGKSFVDQVDNFREQYNSRDYWHFVTDVDFTKDVKNRMPAFVQELENYVQKIDGVSGKTIPNIKYTLKTTGDKKDQTLTVIKNLKFNTDYTATLEPDGLTIPWEIVTTIDDRLVKTKHVKLNVLNKDILLEDLESYLLTNELSGGAISKYNREYRKAQRNRQAAMDTVIVQTAFYDRQVYDLNNTSDVRSLLEKISNDIAGLEYQIPEQNAAVEWQRTKKVEALERKLRLMEQEGKTLTDEYKNTLAEYNTELEKLRKMESKLGSLELRQVDLANLKTKYQHSYQVNLQRNLNEIRQKKNFITEQISRLEKEKKNLEANGKADQSEYEMILQSLKNKDSELLEVIEKENKLLELIAGGS